MSKPSSRRRPIGPKLQGFRSGHDGSSVQTGAAASAITTMARTPGVIDPHVFAASYQTELQQFFDDQARLDRWSAPARRIRR